MCVLPFESVCVCVIFNVCECVHVCIYLFSSVSVCILIHGRIYGRTTVLVELNDSVIE